MTEMSGRPPDPLESAQVRYFVRLPLTANSDARPLLTQACAIMLKRPQDGAFDGPTTAVSVLQRPFAPGSRPWVK